MLKSFIKLHQRLTDDVAKVQNSTLGKIIQNYSLHYLNILNNDFDIYNIIDQSKIMIVNKYEEKYEGKTKRFFIICLENAIIFFEEENSSNFNQFFFN